MKRYLLLVIALALVFVWQSNASATLSLSIADVTIPVGAGPYTVPVTISSDSAVTLTGATFQFVSLTGAGELVFSSPTAMTTGGDWSGATASTIPLTSQFLWSSSISGGTLDVSASTPTTIANFKLTSTPSLAAGQSFTLTIPVTQTVNNEGGITSFAPVAGSITAVPEPGSMALLALVGGGVAAIGGWRRRRGK